MITQNVVLFPGSLLFGASTNSVITRNVEESYLAEVSTQVEYSEIAFLYTYWLPAVKLRDSGDRQWCVSIGQ